MSTAEHPFSEHLTRVRKLEASSPHRSWSPSDAALPALFISHGAPPLFEDSQWMAQLADWTRRFPKPKAILIVSAHWESAPLMLSAATPSSLIYDFGGFAPMYYEMRYDTPDGSSLADRIAAVLPDNQPIHLHPQRGLDHGAWVPLKVMYPEADIPALQLSIPTDDGTDLIALGRYLRRLREEGVLIIGSGHMTHGLQFVDWRNPDTVPTWSSEFDAWAADALERHDIDSLLAFRQKAPGMPYSHPTADHFLPLFVALGAADDAEAKASTTIDGYLFGLSKRSIQIG